MKRPIFIYSVDWFQYYCHQSSNPTLGDELHGLSPNRQGYVSTYKVETAHEWSALYNEHYCITLNHRPIAHIHYSPKMSALHSMSASIKMENSALYSPDWYFYLHDIIGALRWTIQNITRVDICCDFNTFLNGRDPEKFCADYLRVPTKGRPSYLRMGKDKWHAIGQKYVSENKVEYLRWGTRESEVCTYLYNKSKELRDKKYKPWIAREWKAAGLDVQKVWRVEFSINSKGLALFDISKQLYKPLFATDLDTQEDIARMFHIFAAQYFRFKLCKAGDGRRKSRLPDVKLFPPSPEISLKHKSVAREIESGKTERVLINRLQQILDSDLFLHTEDFESVGKTIDILNHLYSLRGQTLGYKKRIANDLVCFFDEINDTPSKHKPYDVGAMMRSQKAWDAVYKWYMSGHGTYYSMETYETPKERKKRLLSLLLEDTSNKKINTILIQLLTYLEGNVFTQTTP